MAFDYESMRATADELIADFGFAVSLVKRTQGTFDATTGNLAGAGETSYSFNAVEIPQDDKYIDGKHYEWNDEFHAGSQTHVNEVGFFISPLLRDGTVPSVAPAIGDAILAGSVRFVILETHPINPAGTALLYQVRARR